LFSGVKELNGNSATLNSGAKQLANGADKLNKNVPSLTDGIDKLAEGSDTLAKGTDKLNNNSEKLKDGSAQLVQGAETISDGSTKLYKGSKTMGTGLSTLNDGVEELYTGLSDGAKTAEETTLSDTSKEMFASPVETKETQVTTVDNNGSAMAAYMMCAGLWVAALAFCIVTGAEKDPERIKKKKKLCFRKIAEILLFAIGSGAVLVTLLININGLDPAYLGRTIALAIMTSLAFTCIVYFFNILLGKIGSFVLLVLLVIQLGCAGGTYPLDLSPQGYSSIKPFFPFSYAVDGFRMTIATGQDITNILLVLGAFALVFAILSVVVTVIKVKSKKEKEYSMAELLDEAFAG
jgi:putative membrane protein